MRYDDGYRAYIVFLMLVFAGSIFIIRSGVLWDGTTGENAKDDKIIVLSPCEADSTISFLCVVNASVAPEDDDAMSLSPSAGSDYVLLKCWAVLNDHPAP